MSTAFLCDPKTLPSDEAVFSLIGRAKPLWEAFFAHQREAYPDASADWRYYKDGKSWLLKVTKGKKTLCWVSLGEGTFRATFYFADSSEPAILASALPAGLKQQFREGKHYGKIRGVTVVFKKKGDVEAAKILLALRAAT